MQISNNTSSLWNSIWLHLYKVVKRGIDCHIFRTFSLGLYGDNLAGIPTTRRSDRHNPDAVLPVLVQVGQTTEVNIRSSLKLTDHL